MILKDSTIYAIPKNLKNVKKFFWLEISTVKLQLLWNLHVKLLFSDNNDNLW